MNKIECIIDKMMPCQIMQDSTCFSVCVNVRVCVRACVYAHMCVCGFVRMCMHTRHIMMIGSSIRYPRGDPVLVSGAISQISSV